MVGVILSMLGHELSEETLREIIAEVDVDGNQYYFIVNLISITCSLYHLIDVSSTENYSLLIVINKIINKIEQKH